MKNKLRRSIELLLWIVAALSFGTTAVAFAVAMQADHAASKLVESSAQSDRGAGGQSVDSGVQAPDGRVVSGPAHPTLAAKNESRQSDSEVIGRIRIVALGLSVPMTSGVEMTSLLRGVGHIDGTALPGGLGTLGLAGHRDTYLRPLERIARGMDIEVNSGSGTYHYTVDSSEIVTPEQVDVLSIRMRPELVLITCFPFHYIGAAPKRFVVHAHLVSLTPDRPDLRSTSLHGGR